MPVVLVTHETAESAMRAAVARISALGTVMEEPALIRIEAESYGVCLHCDEDISVKRLNAVPWAPYCITCQEQYDAHKMEGDEVFDDMLTAA